MRIDFDTMQDLLDVQQLDLEIIRANKQLEELPEREAIRQARAKRAEIAPKRERVAELQEAAKKKIAGFEAEDAKLSEKQERIQSEIDQLSGDYRAVESRTKELNGCAKRRGDLEALTLSAIAELDKIEAVANQLDAALARLAADERAQTESFVKRGTALKGALASCDAKRDAALSALPKEVLTAYERAYRRGAGMAVGVLDGPRCGVCRHGIEQGRLTEMKREGNLANCPNCKRLLILQ